MASLGHSSRRCVVFRLMALSRWRSVIATFGLLAVVFVGLAVSARGRGVAPARHGHVVPRAAARYSVQIQAVFDRFGDPLLVANFTPDGSRASPVWLLCPAATPDSCHSVQAHHGELAPGAEPAGTRFVATAVYRGARYSRAATWHGRVHALRPPRLAGARRMGGLVRPAAGRWAGGWGDESDQLGVEACRLATGQECRMLGGGELGCPDRSSLTRLGGWFTSWYLFAVDARILARLGLRGNRILRERRSAALECRSHGCAFPRRWQGGGTASATGPDSPRGCSARRGVARRRRALSDALPDRAHGRRQLRRDVTPHHYSRPGACRGRAGTDRPWTIDGDAARRRRTTDRGSLPLALIVASADSGDPPASPAEMVPVGNAAANPDEALG